MKLVTRGNRWLFLVIVRRWTFLSSKTFRAHCSMTTDNDEDISATPAKAGAAEARASEASCILRHWISRTRPFGYWFDSLRSFVVSGVFVWRRWHPSPVPTTPKDNRLLTHVKLFKIIKWIDQSRPGISEPKRGKNKRSRKGKTLG